MAKKHKEVRPKPRLPKGMRDVTADELRAIRHVQSRIREVYELYGFEPLETPAFEYSDALGKFLPDQDRPNAGVFSFEDEDGQWVSLRYDLTAPLARYVAEHYDALPKPFRRYQTGDVWRNEKPGPGRYRQFIQFDADTVGTANIAADAEICMLAADTLEHLGIARGDYAVRVNNRKVLDGILETAGLDPFGEENAGKRLIVLRAIDKLDRLGVDGVELLLGDGRKDESGDFTHGAKLEASQIGGLMRFVTLAQEALDAGASGALDPFAGLEACVGASETGREGVAELRALANLAEAAGFGPERIRIDPAIVRGLDYYTGPVLEAELTFETPDEQGTAQRFGSVGGGGRYDGLVKRFKGIEVPATGMSIGVSRLVSALAALKQQSRVAVRAAGPVVVMVLDAQTPVAAQAAAQELRAAGLRAEMYVGNSAMKAQMKYADRRGASVVVIEGDDERARGEVTLKDLVEGERLSAEIEDNETWRAERPAQFSVPRGDLVKGVKEILERYAGEQLATGVGAAPRH